MAVENIHVPGMKRGQSFELMSGERRGNATAPNRSTVMRTDFEQIDTVAETYSNKNTSLHKTWPRGPLSSQEATYKSVSNCGKTKVG